MDLVTYAVPFFLLLIAFEYAWGKWRGRNTYRLNDSVNSLSLGVLSTSIKLLGLNIGGLVFTRIEEHYALVRLATDSVWNWLFALLLYDFCYYWFHRISHERTLLWASHVAHHQSEEFNLSTALRQTSTGFLLGWVFYIPCFLAGVPAEMFVTVGSAHLIYQFWIHSQHIPRLGVLEWFLITASNHRVHHAQNALYVDRNYGGLLVIWDRLFGTFQEERDEEPPVYGILGPLHSWNPLWANLHIYAQMLRDMRHTARLRDRLRILVGRTGWRPADVAARFPVTKGDPAHFRRFDPPLARGVRSYVMVQFVILVALALWIEQQAPAAGLFERYAMFGYLLLGLVALGVLMERAAAGKRLEYLRLGLTALLAVALPAGAGPAWAGAALLGYSLVSLALAVQIAPPVPAHA